MQKRIKENFYNFYEKRHLKGVISVSKIDNFNKTCDISLLTDKN